jgi:Fe-S-cluster containining protein
MKVVPPQDIDQLPGRQLAPGDEFSFRCHAGVACFNRCCRNLNLFLYPYDVVRLTHRLDITSDQFIEKYIDVVLRPDQFFPEVVLRMADNAEKTCPFLTLEGCAVYPDRPDTCRTFPIEQGAIFEHRTGSAKSVFFYRPPDFCQGQYEKQSWTISTWTHDQEASQYHRMTHRWSEIRHLFQSNPWGPEGPEGPRAKMAFMAAYNMEQFREFVFGSSFFKRYRVKSTIKKKLRRSNEALLLFGFDWIKLFLWGIHSKQIRPRK